MAVKFYNTLSGEKEEFRPIKDKQVGLYTCGPTVYDSAHIGNLRSYLFSDILRRTLEYNEYKVNSVVNITDVGHLVSDGDEGNDKMTKALKREGKPMTLEAMKEIGEFYASKFKDDLYDLNIERPNTMPKASEHIEENIELIKKLEEKKFTYKTSDGIYFDTSEFKEYGKLGNIKYDSEGRARVEENPEKKNPRDFALWKFSQTPAERGKLGWESPWGKGFPGWHIECSSMSVKYLDQPFDIHAGGIGLIPVHHQNEIAQSEAAYDKPLANYWMHGEFLVMNKEKMSKSEGGVITLETIKEKGFNPLAYRFVALGAHYRSSLNFSWEAMEGAKNGLDHLYNQIRNLGGEAGEINKEYKEKFTEKINDDLNMPQAMAVVQELLKSDLPANDKLATILDLDRVLGLRLDSALSQEEIPEGVQKLAEERKEARQQKNWQKSDDLRQQIKDLGYEVEDLPENEYFLRVL